MDLKGFGDVFAKSGSVARAYFGFVAVLARAGGEKKFNATFGFAAIVDLRCGRMVVLTLAKRAGSAHARTEKSSTAFWCKMLLIVKRIFLHIGTIEFRLVASWKLKCTTDLATGEMSRQPADAQAPDLIVQSIAFDRSARR